MLTRGHCWWRQPGDGGGTQDKLLRTALLLLLVCCCWCLSAACRHVSFSGPDAVAAAASARQALCGGGLAAQQLLAGHEVTTCKFSKWLPDASSTAQELQDLHDEPAQQPPPPPVLLSTEAAGIPGLTLIPDFVCAEQEAQLLAAVDAAPWLRLSKRRVQHYGFEFKYSQRGVDLQQRVGQIPSWAAGLAARMEVGEQQHARLACYGQHAVC